MDLRHVCWLAVSLILFGLPTAWPATTFRVATFNLEGYLTEPTDSRPAKSEQSRINVHNTLLKLQPDVLALQEVGGTNALLEIQMALAKGGLELPYWDLVQGADTNIQVAVLSRFPFSARRPHEREDFLLNGRRFRVSRGFAEVDIIVATNYSFTLLTAHLKSKRPVFSADEAELRLEEAKLLREKIDARLAEDPQANLVVLGDLNDTKDAASTKAVMGRYRNKLVDTRPAERNGDGDLSSGPGLGTATRNITWTHYYSKEDSYSRIDFILLSQGMAREWMPNETYVFTSPDWGLASDHRPVAATFRAEDL